MAYILVVDDDIDVAETIQRSLSNKGYSVTAVYDGIEALKAIQKQKPDLIVLDIRLPHMSGLEVCRRLRQDPQTADIPIIFLTALTHLDNKLEGFEAGADDYITKPFETSELELRIRQVLRRGLFPAQFEPGVLIVDELSLDRHAYEARTRTKTALLTPIEFDLLYLLMYRAGEVFSSKQLLQEVWDYPSGMGDPALVRMHIENIRDKIEDDPRQPRLLRTVERRGYVVGSDETTGFLQGEVKRLRAQLSQLYRRIKVLEKREPTGKAETIPLGELGRFVSGIVHDLRGGLGIISNTADFMLDDIDINDPLANDLRKIVHSAQFCEVVIRDLMVLGGEEAFEPTEVNIERVVCEVFFMLGRKLVDVKLIVEADTDTPTIVADEGQMKQVFMNLIKNAGEAMPDGGTLSVRTRREGQALRIEVSDTGCGISPENLARLFRKFFTTKAQGYGLGLYIVNTIIGRHGGTIEVQSQLGEGTTFILHLPVE